MLVKLGNLEKHDINDKDRTTRLSVCVVPFLSFMSFSSKPLNVLRY